MTNFPAKASATAAATAEMRRMRPKAIAAGPGAKAETFDYGAEAELFSVGGRKAGRQRLGYRRFAVAAEAVRFAVENLPPEQLAATHLQVEEMRFNAGEIRSLYDSADYTLVRAAPAPTNQEVRGRKSARPPGKSTDQKI